MVDSRGLRVGVIAADPVRCIGLVAILEDTLGVEAVPIPLQTALGDLKLTALLLDIRCSYDELLQTLARFDREVPGLKILVMGGPIELHQVQALIGAGAKGFLPETVGESEIRMAMEVILDGSIWAPRKVLARLIEEGKKRSPSGGVGGKSPATSVDIHEVLTARELEVLRLLMNGRSNREIASAIDVEPATVKAHLGRMLRKTGATNRIELFLLGVEDRGKT